MENRSNAFGQHTGGAAGASTVLQIREEWRLAREAHKDLQVAGMPRTNLLLVGSQRVLDWFDQTAGRIRVVSTTRTSLWPLLKSGAFNDALYYRLNTVCVDIEV